MDGIKIRYLETMRHTQLGERNVLYNEVYIWETENKKRCEEAVKALERNRFPFEFLSETRLLFSGECNVIRLKSIIEDFGPEDSSLLEIKQVKGIAYDQLADTLKAAMQISCLRTAGRAALPTPIFTPVFCRCIPAPPERRSWICA